MAKETKELQKKEATQPQGAERTRERKAFVPNVDIIERKDDILLISDMPGVDEKSIDITLDKNVLTINGYVEPEVPDKCCLAYAEYSIGDYERTFTLSDEIDRNGIEASVKNGVLRLTLPKAPAMKERKIAVKAEA
jgi:HSP20 family molecular chaperone IbpA